MIATAATSTGQPSKTGKSSCRHRRIDSGFLLPSYARCLKYFATCQTAGGGDL